MSGSMFWLQGCLFGYYWGAKALWSNAKCSGHPMIHLRKHPPMSLDLLLYGYRSG